MEGKTVSVRRTMNSYEAKQGIDFRAVGSLVDIHYKVEKLRVGRELRLIALGKEATGLSDYKRNKAAILAAGRDRDRICAEVHDRLVSLENYLEEQILSVVETHPVWTGWAKDVKGVSPMLLAKAMGRCDIQRLTTASKMRAHIGMAPHQKRERGRKLDYDPILKSIMWVIGRQLRYAGGVYYDKYLEWKNYYTRRCRRNGTKILPTPRGKWQCLNCGAIWQKKKDIDLCCATPDVEKQVKAEPPGVLWLGHLDLMAMRKMISLFAIHLWAVWREAEGLPVPEPWILSPHAGEGRHWDYIPPLRDNHRRAKQKRKNSGGEAS